MRGLWTSALLLASSAAAQTPAPDPVDLMRRSAVALKANSPKTRQYTYREYRVSRDFDKNGKETGLDTETWEVIGLEGSTYRKQVMRNDKPLPPKDQKREDERLRRESDRRKRETSEQRRQRVFSYSFSFPYIKAPDIYDLQYKGEETVRGRRTHIVEGMPKPGFRPATDHEKEALNYRLKVWLDAEDLCPARIETDVIGEHSRVQKGSIIHQDIARNEDGVWLTLEMGFRYNVRFFKLLGGRGDHVTTFSDYRKFQVDSRILDAPEK